MKMTLNFNSRTHVECDLSLGAEAYENEEISTHALTWSATSGSVLYGIQWLHFNSRTHVECD